MCVPLCFVLICPPLYHCPPPFPLPHPLLDPSFLQISPAFCLYAKCIPWGSLLRFSSSFYEHTNIHHIHILNFRSRCRTWGKYGNCLSEFGLLCLRVISNSTYLSRRRREPFIAVGRIVVLCSLYRNQCDIFSKQLKLEPHHSTLGHAPKGLCLRTAEARELPCLLLSQSQKPASTTSLDEWEKKYGTQTGWEFSSAERKKFNQCFLFKP